MFFYFYTTLFSSWMSYVPANAIYEMCGELTPSPLSWCMWKDARKVRRGGEGAVYRAGSLRNFRSAVAAAIVWHCNICWRIDVNYVATGLLNKLTKHRAPQNSGNFLAKSEIIRFSREILVYLVSSLVIQSVSDRFIVSIIVFVHITGTWALHIIYTCDGNA